MIPGPRPIVAVYCDGGVIRSNPSPYGGVWAWVAVAADGGRLAEASGVLEAPPGTVVGNNYAEYVAAVLALEARPAGWAGTLYSDSELTLRRLCRVWQRGPQRVEQEALAPLRGIPAAWRTRGAAAVARLGTFRGVLLGGHPPAAALRAGADYRGFPVSVHNVYVDRLCRQAAAAYQAALDRTT
jgi:ribonuclease HI